ncbi:MULTISPECIES: APC family permease [unclassified Treponema]|uniref:APC family permease n=1 Tax=unclassified Treponema TaxID=2638727 RepID=UPI0020A5F172|nr:MULTISPECIES: amino acid permease [unclassified Treponema]UTC66952.1 amino acid permease [Treponema sp. OMZ 789]UTC69681.1 amino acid permease [Treponema sp. OMZ 790]UTC72395.1 amino acid permease [Treponema sp. OMZ 791]
MENKGKLGLLSICLLGVNAIVGTGVFLLPGKAAKLVGVSSIGIILFDAVLVILIALCFAEAGGLFKKNGGPYVYAKEAFGEFVGFEVGFMKWAIMIIAWAAMAVGFPTALGSVFPAAAEPLWRSIIAVAILLFLGLMNIAGVRISKIVNNVITIGKLVPLIFFILLGIFFIQGDNFQPMQSVGALTTTSFGAAALLIFYPFTGFESIAVAAEDMDKPEKNVPLAIVLVISGVSVFYILIQVVAIGILGDGLTASEAPIADAAAKFLGPVAKAVVTTGTLVSIGGINVASSFLAPRSAVALADDGFLPKFVTKRNKKDVPYIAVILTTALTALVCLTGSFSKLAAISVVSRFAQYIPTCLAILVFRKRGMKGSFRIPGVYVVSLLAVGISLWLLYNSSLDKIIFGLGGLVVGAVFYVIMKLTQKKTN